MTFVARSNSLASDPTQDEHHLASDDSMRIRLQQQPHRCKNTSNPKALLASYY